MPLLQDDTTAPPALLLGGADNAVSAARRLVEQGVRVLTLAEDRAPAHRVRGVRPAPLGDEVSVGSLGAWFDEHGDRWEGSVLLPLSDPAMKYVAGEYSALSDRFLPTRMKPDVMAAMLDKQRTIELADRAGVATPGQWSLEQVDDLERFVDDVSFPVLIKPRATFELVKRIGRKYLPADTKDELVAGVRELENLPGGIAVVEFVPGPDSLLSSYYALREDGAVLCEFTKRVFRRHPINEGPATLHEMVHLEDTAVAGRRFFDGVGLEGLGNVEFKRDVRDGQLKLIECNHRMTAATELIQRSGIDLVTAVYQQARGLAEPLGAVPSEQWYWYPFPDLKAARQVSTKSLFDWLYTPLRRPVLPYWRLSDPGPSIQNTTNWARGMISRRLGG